MSLDLEAIKARAEAATPGPWECVGMGDVVTPTFVIQTTDRNPADGRFIANARTDVPALVAEVERLQAEVDELRHYTAVSPFRVDL